MSEVGVLHVAQINIGTMIAPPGDAAVAEFMDALDRVNALADGAPGFVWRLQTDAGNATSIQVFADPLQLLNMSVWTSVDAMREYVYRGEHVDFFRRRSEWFERDAKRVALWWIPAGEIPDIDEAVRRVEFLERHGPSPYAFGFAPPQPPLVIEQTHLDDPETAGLVARLNVELRAAANDPSENHFDLTHDETSGDNGRMLRARLDGRLVGCGALRRIEDAVGEIKRMFVDPSARGMKVGAAILDQLEITAVRMGLGQVKLETGPRQTAAIGLYESSGYARCPAWGEYLLTPESSRCYAKNLAAPLAA